LAAITTTLLGLLAPGDHLLMVDSTYEPTRIFCNGTLKRMGVEVEYYDPLIGAGIAALMRPNSKLVFVESPGSLSFEVQDVPAIAAVAHRHGALVVADSTWATPLGWRSFELGIDVSLHAATKYIVGHSDVMMGVILCNAATYPGLRRFHCEMGLTVSSDDAYLALRGLRTLAARLAMHGQHARAVAQWLQVQPEVDTVLYPPLASSPGHDLWQRDFLPQYACGLLCVQFKVGISKAQVDALVDATCLFGIGYSWGGYESLILPVNPSRLRAVTAERWAGKAMVRLHIGLEDPADLIADLEQGFDVLRSTVP
ncbi:MAG: cystathionine beta-lyase, partial [Paucibacter sp.]|nr:cystathionine beta-lyase [Roseateles sp.]